MIDFTILILAFVSILVLDYVNNKRQSRSAVEEEDEYADIRFL